MPEVEGLVATLIVGVVGAAIAEAIRIAGAFQKNNPPTGGDWIATLILVCLGAGVLFYGWEDKQAALEVAQIGAAFPLLFSAGVRALTEPEEGPANALPTARTLTDYIAARF